jgi:hypothetical protein
MTFFYGNFRKIDLLHHPSPLSVGEILPFSFVATSKTEALHHPPPISPTVMRQLCGTSVTQILFYLYNILTNDSRNKSTPPFAAY